MKILSLGLTESSDAIRVLLEQGCPGLEEECLRLAIDSIQRGCYTFLGWNITEGELSFRNYERIKNMLKQHVSKQLADIIITKEEIVLLKKIINDNYHYFSESERGIILDHAVKLLENGSALFPDFLPAVRRNEILAKLQEYFDGHHELVLEGFITFRLKEYRAKLVGVVDKAVDEYMLDLEYKDFIRVLRYFLDVQEVQIEEVHVIIGDEGNFKLRDSFGKSINNQYLENYVMNSSGEINYEDLLISALITIAPQHVMIHCAPNVKADDVIGTIKGVFEGRVVRCTGCDLCRGEIIGVFKP